MILIEMFISEIRKNNLRLKNVNPQLLVIHPDRLRKVISENPYLLLLAQEKEAELKDMADNARTERQVKEKERSEIIATQKAEARKVRLAEIALENEEKEKELALQQKEIQQKKEELRTSRAAAADASKKAFELLGKKTVPGTDSPAVPVNVPEGTAAELKKQLKKLKIKFPASASKAKLQELVAAATQN